MTELARDLQRLIDEFGYEAVTNVLRTLYPDREAEEPVSESLAESFTRAFKQGWARRP